MKLHEHGFITNYLISGPKESQFQDNHEEKNQLKYEQYLRSIVADDCFRLSEEKVEIGKKSDLGLPWEYYYSYGNWFVDKSDFYPLLRKIELLAVVCIVVEEAVNVNVNLWTYGACHIWVNKQHAGKVTEPVYKPMIRKEMVFNLQKGRNEIYIRFQNLGVRDTRNIFGIQLLNNRDKIKISLPNQDIIKEYEKLDDMLSNLTLDHYLLRLKEKLPYKLTLRYDHRTDDYRKQKKRYEDIDITGQTSIPLKRGQPFVTIMGEINGTSLSRKLEISEAIMPQYVEYGNGASNYTYVYQQIANVGQMLRGLNDRFSIYNVLARCAVNRVLPEDESEIYNDLMHIENRRDCSDFLTCGLMRYIHLNPMDEKMKKRTKEVLLNYRYWMDDKGSDGMCFWSENHSLMFFISALMAGELYPNDIFTRSGKTGLEMVRIAKIKVLQWLDDVLEQGFEEFQSGGYTPITFSALLNVIDFEDGELREKAKAAADKIVTLLAIHTFMGSVISPQGRVYREVLYPFSQSVQTLIHLMDQETPYAYCEWLSTMATSSYKFPKGLKILMQEISTEYTTGNALVKLHKTKDYVLTSVQSKRMDENPHMWKNRSFEEEADRSSYLYCKSLNECFHGTTRFEPGVYGYQQHMWYGAVDNDTVVFVNHPGGTCDATTMRPGYWFGNGIMPAIKQEGSMIGAVYVISEDYPITFTHLYFPIKRFDKTLDLENWKFGKKGNSYIAIWCSHTLVPHNDQIFDCEYRSYGAKSAYLCQCGSSFEYGDFQEFIDYCQKLLPELQEESNTLRVRGDGFLQFVRHNNRTQYV